MKRISALGTYVLTAAGLAAIVLGIVLRTVETLNGNYVFGFDQGLDTMAASSIAFAHKFTLIGAEAGAGFAGLPGIFHGPGYRYILAGLLLMGAGNPYWSIVFLCAVSLAVIFALTRLSNRIFGNATARLVLLLSAVSLPLTAQARMIWAPNYSGVLVMPFLYALWMSRKKTLVSVFLTAFLAASLYHFEIPMAVPALVAVGVYFAVVLRVRDIRRWIVIAAGALMGFLPMILFEARHGWNIVRGVLSYGTRVTQGAQAKPFQPIAELIGDGNALLATVRESFSLGIPGMTYLFPFILFSAAIWYVYHEKKKEQQQYMTGILLLIFAHLIIYYPYRGPVYSHYFSLLYFVYPILGAYTGMKAMHGKVGRWVALGLLGVLLVNVFYRFPKIITYDYRDYGGTAKIRGKIDAIDFIYTDARGERFNLAVFTPPVYTYAYDYLLGWHASKRYGYVPGTSLENTVYLLIEPDPEKPWSYNGWLETVIKKGNVTASWKLPSGFIIEKRIMEETK